MKRYQKSLAGLLAALMLTCSCVTAPALEPEDGSGQVMEEAVAFTAAAVQAEIAAAAGVDLSADLPVRSAILIEQTSGRVLYAYNEHEAMPPASVTKIMSLLLIVEAIESGKIALTDVVSCSENAAGFGGSQIWLKPGEEMTVEDLLKASAIASANDATVCLAEYVAGSETAFVAMMNERAHQLGMSDTQFFCAAGLDTEGHQSSAADIAIMSRALLEHPMILNYTTVWMDSLRDGATQLVNTNRLVRFYQGATGLKTGTTSGAGCCLSASAERSGLGLIAVVMGAATSDDRFASARALLDWGFANYEFHQLEPPELVQPLPVSGGVASEIELFCAQPDGIVIEKGQLSALTQELVLPESVTAPILSGDAVGSVVVCVHGERVAEYPVFAANTVEKMTLPRAFVILGKKLFSMN